MVSSNGFLHRVPDQNSNDKFFFRFSQSTGKCRAQPVKSVFRESYGKFLWKPASLVSFSSEIFWWNLFWHVTPPVVSNDTVLFFDYCWIYIWMLKYLSGLFLKRNFLEIFIFTFDTQIGVKLHLFELLPNIFGWT